MMNRLLFLTVFILGLWSCKTKAPAVVKDTVEVTPTAPTSAPTTAPTGIPALHETHATRTIKKALEQPALDGAGTEKVWELAEWRNMDQVMLGETPSSEDFQGRYKMLWDEDMIYILAEIQDDKFMDQHEDGLYKYWDDDCLEIFIDEDYSGGNHQYNHTAFAYHLSMDDKAVDLGLDEKPHYYTDHFEISKKKERNSIVWELGLKVYGDRYYNEDKEASRVKLSEGKRIGFMLAYCDNDNSDERENFVGDMYIDREDKNIGWIDAGVFGQVILR